MLTEVKVRNLSNEDLPLPIGGYGRFVVKNITGLGPTKATITATNYGSIDGSYFTTSRAEMRNIVITIGYRPDYGSNETVSSLRQELYRWFMPKADLKFSFTTDDIGTLTIDGVVETVDPVIFSAEPEIQISILCAEPHFIGASHMLDGIINTPIDVEYAGTVASGFLTMMTLTSAITAATVERTYPSSPGQFRYEGPLATGWRLHMSSRSRKKYVHRFAINNIRSNGIRYAKGFQEEAITWPILQPGKNTIEVRTNPAAAGTFKLEWLDIYGGL